MSKKNDMNFLGHLEELRWHIIRSIIAILIFAIAAFIFKEFIFDKVILAPRTPNFPTNKLLKKIADYLNTPALAINQEPLDLINIKMAGQFAMHITVSIVTGIILAFPYIFNEFWRFIKPALYRSERKYARGSIFYTSFLFAVGILFGYYIISPLSVNFLGTYHTSEQVDNQINLGSYISLVTSVVLSSGIVFELPVLIYFLSKIGLVDATFLKKYRRHSIVLILILSAIITPPDAFSLILVCLPLILLYEVGIIISSKVVKNKLKEENKLTKI